MAADQAVWGIEIGQCALKALRLQKNPGSDKIEAVAFDFIEHPKILSQPDADPDQLTQEALETFLSRNNLKGDKVYIGVPGQAGLARFIKLPPVEQSRIPEIVRYEARQQIPFALEEVIWDYQTIKGDDETEGLSLETEVGLFAMKRDLIDRYISPFLTAGVEVDGVQMRPLAEYNFAGCDRFDLAVDDVGEENYVLLLDIGADNSDLVITNGQQIWQRNLALGGNHFTRALTKELKLTFAKAEHLKRNAGKAKDPRAIFQAMRPVFNDFVSEIQRSVGYFASVHRSAKIQKIVGVGNAFKLPGLQKFLSQNLKYEVEKVEKFERLVGDSVVTAPQFQENILSFTACYGLAAQGLGLSPIRTSLLPPEITQARLIRRKKPWALTAAAMVLGGMTVMFAGGSRFYKAVENPAYDSPRANSKNAKDFQKQKGDAFNAAKASWETVKNRGVNLTGIVDTRLHWLEVLNNINQAVPSNMILSVDSAMSAELEKGVFPNQLRQVMAQQGRELGTEVGVKANKSGPGWVVTDMGKQTWGLDHKFLLVPNDDKLAVFITTLPESIQLAITEIDATYVNNVKSDWYDTFTDENDWSRQVRHPYDDANAPSGPGWVFKLTAHHFNKAGSEHTVVSSLGALQRPDVYINGIRCVVLTENTTVLGWAPGQRVTRKTSARKKQATGGGSGGGPGSQNLAGGGAAMNMGDGGAGGAGGGAMGGAGEGSTGGTQAREKARTTLNKTLVTLEFVWQPDTVPNEAQMAEALKTLTKAMGDAGDPKFPTQELIQRSQEVQPVEPPPSEQGKAASSPGGPPDQQPGSNPL